jgi:hypothetical protein
MSATSQNCVVVELATSCKNVPNNLVAVATVRVSLQVIHDWHYDLTDSRRRNDLWDAVLFQGCYSLVFRPKNPLRKSWGNSIGAVGNKKKKTKTKTKQKQKKQ